MIGLADRSRSAGSLTRVCSRRRPVHRAAAVRAPTSGREADLGSVTAGKLADLLLLDADPTKDIANTRGIRSVVLAGRFLSRGDLDEMLKNVRTLSND